MNHHNKESGSTVELISDLCGLLNSPDISEIRYIRRNFCFVIWVPKISSDIYLIIRYNRVQYIRVLLYYSTAPVYPCGITCQSDIDLVSHSIRVRLIKPPYWQWSDDNISSVHRQPVINANLSLSSYITRYGAGVRRC